ALLAVICLMTAGSAVAVGLGELKVHSYLNQPFDATVELLNTEGVRNLQVDLAGPSRFQSMNVRVPSNLSTFTANMALVQGQSVVQITSRVPVTDLVIDLVLVMSADGSQSVRHYPIIIDFAPQIDGVVTTPLPVEPVSEPQPAAPPPPRRVAAVRSDDTYGPVRSGQTLSGIVDEIAAGQGLNGYALMQAIVDLNPQAFINGDMNRLRAGASLTLPSLDGFTPLALTPGPDAPPPVPTAEPPQAVQPQADSNLPEPGGDRRSPARSGDDRLELVGTPDSGEILTSLNDWLDEDDTELGLRAQEARRDLAYATAEIETYRKENTLLKDRVSELETRLDTLRKLIALRAAEEAGTLTPEEQALLDEETEAQIDEELAQAPSALPPPADPAEAPAPEPEASAPIEVESELAAAVQPTESDSSSSGIGWWPWALGVVILLIITFVVWYRGRREDQIRAQRTADLVHRIQQAGKRNTGQLE
ncbi:MAG: hypothetical protein AAGA23_18095, partial [Pseudomonadota bacterium]